MNNKRKSAVLMTQGSIAKNIISFTLPLFLGNLFQQMYNAADSLIVGNFIGSEALAAVSSSGSLIWLLVGFLNGISLGAGVVIARYFGAGDTENMKRAIHTTVAFGIIAGILLTIVGMAFTPAILRMMGTPAAVLPSSIIYFRVYCMGSLASVMYNIFVGILQSVGDSRHPLYYLMVSSVINIVLDVLFVAVLGYGVGSAALATVISQVISALLCFIQLVSTKEEYRLCIRDIRLDLPMMQKVVRNGLPAGIQNSINAFANVVVQSNINAFGEMAVAGCGAYAKIEGFGFLPVTCFTMALTTFVSQNLGAKEYERAKKGAAFGVACCMGIAQVVGIIVYFFAPSLIRCFNQDPLVIDCGVTHARIICLFFFVVSYCHCIMAIFRGTGHSTIPMLVTLASWCVFRIIFITVTIQFVPSISVVSWAFPVTWFLSASLLSFMYFRKDWMKLAL